MYKLYSCPMNKYTKSVVQTAIFIFLPFNYHRQSTLTSRMMDVFLRKHPVLPDDKAIEIFQVFFGQFAWEVSGGSRLDWEVQKQFIC